MAQAAEMFAQTIIALRSNPNVKPHMMPDLQELRDLAETFDQSGIEQVFQGIVGQVDASLLYPFLGLADEMKLAWELDGSFGEFDIASPLNAWFADFPEPYRAILSDFAPLENIGYLDQTTDFVPTSFVIFDKTAIDERGLWLFDTRSAAPIELSGQEYLQLCNLGLGFDSWQFLFSSLPITPDRRQAIVKTLSALEREFPDRDFSVFKRRLT